MRTGVYQPRSRRVQLAEAFDDAKRGLVRLIREASLRGAGALLLIVSLAGFAALGFYTPSDASLNNATGDAPHNLLGGFGAAAGDLLFSAFGLAAFAFLAAPAIWGARAIFGRHLRHGVPRLMAWFLGTVCTAAGLGILPAPLNLPAGCGGILGVTVANLSAHVGQVYGVAWIGTAVPALMLMIGLPLAFLATGLTPQALLRGIAGIPAALLS